MNLSRVIVLICLVVAAGISGACSKDKAIEFYNVQLERCNNSIKVHEEGIKDFEDKVMDNNIFDKIEKIAGKLDKKMYKGKYKNLDTYLENYTNLSSAKTRLEIDLKNAEYFKEIIKRIEML